MTGNIYSYKLNSNAVKYVASYQNLENMHNKIINYDKILNFYNSLVAWAISEGRVDQKQIIS